MDKPQFKRLEGHVKLVPGAKGQKTDIQVFSEKAGTP
jgi:hypothetical protein